MCYCPPNDRICQKDVCVFPNIPKSASPRIGHQVTSECFCAVGPLKGSQQPLHVLIFRTFKQKCTWSFALHTHQKFKILATLLVLPRPYNCSCKKNIPVPQKLFLCTVSRLGKHFQEARIHLRMCLSLGRSRHDDYCVGEGGTFKALFYFPTD